jgi:leader peptidase (prepilin peptidase)/N-methyltransferase
MGLGDAKLLMLIGAWTGWPGVLFALFGGAICALGATLLLKLLGKELTLPSAVLEELAELRKAASEGDEEAKKLLDEDPLAEDTGEGVMGRRLPFGPFLILAFYGFIFGLGDRVNLWLFSGI